MFHDESLDKEQVAGEVKNQMTQEPLQTEEVYRVLAKEASLAVFDLGNLGNMNSRLPAMIISNLIDRDHAQEDCWPNLMLMSMN